MQYLVNACGEISKTHNKSYVIDAASQTEAELKAKELFSNEYPVVDENIIYSKVYDNGRLKKIIFSCILMLAAVVISCFTWEIDSFWSFMKPKEISIAPSMISCLFSIFFFSAYVIRVKGIRRTVGSVADIILSVLSIFLISSFFQMILTANNLRFLGIIPLDFMKPEVLLIVGIVFSWFGMKFVTVVVFALISVMAISNIIQLNDAMGVWGVVYIMCAFIGILIWLSAEPSVLEALPQFKKEIGIGYDKFKKELSESTKDIEK